MIKIHSRVCPECGSSFQGRIDKKFCSDPCRSAHNNTLEIEHRNYVRRIHSILKKNRKILTQLKAEGHQQISTEKLRGKGFDFNYCTSYYSSKDGTNHFYCYELGFRLKKKEEQIILIEKEV